mgnify:CR=1 FL=1
MLDKCTLHLMMENTRVATFSADLQHFLEDCYDKAEAMVSKSMYCILAHFLFFSFSFGPFLGKKTKKIQHYLS